jgi:hypothetical protein
MGRFEQICRATGHEMCYTRFAYPAYGNGLNYDGT